MIRFTAEIGGVIEWDSLSDKRFLLTPLLRIFDRKFFTGGIFLRKKIDLIMNHILCITININQFGQH